MPLGCGRNPAPGERADSIQKGPGQSAVWFDALFTLLDFKLFIIQSKRRLRERVEPFLSLIDKQ